MENKQKLIEAEDIKSLIEGSSHFGIDCMLIIYDNQTQDEKEVQDTKELNDIGFSGADGFILSSFSEQVIKWRNIPESDRKYDSPLSVKQIEMMKKKMPKYAKQLINYLPKDFDINNYKLDVNIEKTPKKEKVELTWEDVENKLNDDILKYAKLTIGETGELFNLKQMITAIKPEIEGKQHHVVMFGKHRGTLLLDVPKDYIIWAIDCVTKEMKNV